MFHNHKPYIGDDNDIKELKKIKNKSNEIKNKTGKQKTRYDALIDTWSIRDVKKRIIAKENNLNYLEFFTILELENWIAGYERGK